jgi:hypothetical protein
LTKLPNVYFKGNKLGILTLEKAGGVAGERQNLG